VTTLILKPTDACNARCRYCSAAHPGAAKFMDGETLRQVFELFGDWACDFGRRRLRIIWHGGEPLLMPEAFWEEALGLEDELLRARGITVENGIQTNATRLTSERIPLLKRLLGSKGVVGTSVDPLPGIRELKGVPEGQYARDFGTALEALRAADIRYGLVIVVHRLALPHLEELYAKLRTEHPGTGLRFNPLYRQGRAGEARVWDDLGITAEEWGQALITLHGAWMKDGCPPGVQPFGPWEALHRDGHWGLSCECSGRCFATHFGVDPEGGVFLCGRSSDGASFAFGNASTLTAQALHEHPLRRSLANRSVYLQRSTCRGCTWWRYCHGGCVNDAWLEKGTAFAATYFCGGLKHFFERRFGTNVRPGVA